MTEKLSCLGKSQELPPVIEEKHEPLSSAAVVAESRGVEIESSVELKRAGPSAAKKEITGLIESLENDLNEIVSMMQWSHAGGTSSWHENFIQTSKMNHPKSIYEQAPKERKLLVDMSKPSYHNKRSAPSSSASHSKVGSGH